MKGVNNMVNLNTLFQITTSDLKLNHYRTHQQRGDKIDNKTGKCSNEYSSFDHLEKNEVVGVINHVLKELNIPRLERLVGNSLEKSIHDNYKKWNGKREDAIKWLLDTTRLANL